MQKEEHYNGKFTLRWNGCPHLELYPLYFSIEADNEFGMVQFKPEYLSIVRYVNRLKEHTMVGILGSSADMKQAV